jgi:cell division protein FtsN
MAEDNSARYRSNEPSIRGPAQAAPANDPLAELARLIGKNDPFSDYGQKPAAAAPPVYAPRAEPPQPQAAHPEAAPQFNDDPAPSFLTRPAPQYDSEPQRYSEPAPQPYAPAPRYNSDFPSHNDWPGSAQQAQPASGYPAYEPFVPPPQSYPPPQAPRYDSHDHRVPNFGGQPFAGPNGGYPPPQQHAGFEAPGYAGAPDRQGFPAPLYPHDADAGEMPAPHEDEFYDDEPRSGPRRGLLTVVAVLGLAILGTAGAFGYRSMFGGPGGASPPPVIRASGEPSKVAPPPVTADASSSASKFSYDRFGDAGKDEQVVRREEKPVDLSKAAPRTVLPGAPVVTNGPASKSLAYSGSPAGGNPPSAIGEPRRVRTVPIRPEQGGDVASAPPAQQPPMPTTRSQGNGQSSAQASVPPEPTPRASSRVAMRQPPPAAAPAPSGNAPLSLSPDASNNATPQPTAQDVPPRPAAAPARAAPQPTRVASAPAAPAASGGSYLVQVASQKSEADAESAFRGIQSKYGSVLSGQSHQVRRADLGAKGIYYRAMIGPFGTREAAVQLCSSLKQAGGDCVVQH